MVIQRIQTLYLFLAFIALILFLFVPFGFLSSESGSVSVAAAHLPGLLIATIATLVLVVVSVMMFKQLTPQRRMVVLAMIATCAEIATVAWLLCSGISSDIADASTSWGWGGLFLPVALFFEAAAFRAIGRDRKLLSSYDRLR